jgi:hypothetical protein
LIGGPIRTPIEATGKDGPPTTRANDRFGESRGGRMAYGVVIDDDRDGVPDWRYGIGNMRVDAGDPSNGGWR